MVSEIPAFAAAHGLPGLLAVGSLASVVGGAAFDVETELGDSDDADHVLQRRYPARESLCRLFSPEEASVGAVPV